VPYDDAAEQFAKSGDTRAVPDELLDCYLCERLGVTPLELDAMSVEQVWTHWGYMRGRDIAAAINEDEADAESQT